MFINNKDLWSTALSEIELNVSKANFSTWFKNTYILKQENGIIHLAVPNTFVKEWLYSKYHKSILKALREATENVRNLEYIICKQKEQSKKPPTIDNGLRLDNLCVNKEDNLNPKYTFDSFVVGSFNELANAAAQTIIKQLGQIYNPLFIYGPTGLGKTHLVQAIGNKIKKDDTDKRVYYLTSEKFSVDYINSLQNNTINIFKEKYRKYDVLIMDDIQFLSKKEKTQEELFHVFNSLYDNNKQIIFSSDKHPNYIQDIEERLKSRFDAGMVVDIQKPDHESRFSILKTKSEINNFFLSDEILTFLATAIKGNIRELEGVLNSIFIQTQLKSRNLTLTEIKSLIKNNRRKKKTTSIKDVIHIVTSFYNLEDEVIYQKTRRKEVVRPRQIIMFLLREDFNISYPSIGQELGGRDHTTVIHSCEKIKTTLKEDSMLVQDIEQLRAMF